MSVPRLKAELWIQAHLRVLMANDIQAALVRRGDAVAGSVLLKVNLLDNTAFVLAPAVGPDGGRLWMRATGPAPVSEAEADARIARALKRDPDLWVIEIEDRQGRHGLTEPVEAAPAS